MRKREEKCDTQLSELLLVALFGTRIEWTKYCAKNLERENFFHGFMRSKRLLFVLFFFLIIFFTHVKVACHLKLNLMVALTDLSETNWRSYVI